MRRWSWGDPIDRVREQLNRSDLLFVPSESSYGIAVDPRNPKGVAAVYAVKERDAGKPLLVVIDRAEQLKVLGVDVEAAPVRRLVERVWPAPVTAILPTDRRLAASAGGRTIAVRIPAHVGLRRLLSELDMPLTATSANLSGASPVLEPRELERLFPRVDGLVVDEGRLPGGPPSTLVEPTENGWRLRRVGGVSRSRLQELLGQPVIDGKDST